MWVPKIDTSRGRLYWSIVEAMRTDIALGVLKSGDKLPTQRALAWELEVNLTTVSRAYKEAKRLHLIGGEVGRGTYILANSVEASLFERDNKNMAFSGEFVDLSTNIPARNIDDNRFKTSMADIVACNKDTLFEEYHAPVLISALKIAACKWLSWRKMPSKPRNIILTSGAQSALQAVLIGLCKSGDSVLVEQYTFPGMKDFARQFGLKLIPIKMDEQGILPDDLEGVAKKNSAKFIVLVPSHQNPTGAVMGIKRQRDVARVIKNLDLTLIEDDVYGGLSDMPPLSRLLLGNAIYLTSFSKTVSFGLRLGFIWAQGEYLQNLSHATNLTQWTLSPIMMQMVIDWIDDGTAIDKAQWQLFEIQERRKIADNILPKNLIVTVSKTSPHLWLRVGFCKGIVEKCHKEQVDIATASVFMANSLVHNNEVDYIRISLVAPATRQNLAVGLKRLVGIFGI